MNFVVWLIAIESADRIETNVWNSKPMVLQCQRFSSMCVEFESIWTTNPLYAESLHIFGGLTAVTVFFTRRYFYWMENIESLRTDWEFCIYFVKSSRNGRMGDKLEPIKWEPLASSTGGVKPMAIAGRMVRERERCIGMTPDERAWRAQWLKDQVLSPREPVYVKEYHDAIRNPIRRFYTAPLNALGRALVPILVNIPSSCYVIDCDWEIVNITIKYTFPFVLIDLWFFPKLFFEGPRACTGDTSNHWKEYNWHNRYLRYLLLFQIQWQRKFKMKTMLLRLVSNQNWRTFHFMQDWTTKSGWRVIHSRKRCVPGDADYPRASDRTKPADYATRGFQNAPI